MGGNIEEGGMSQGAPTPSYSHHLLGRPDVLGLLTNLVG